MDGYNGFWIMAGSDQCDFDKMTENLGNQYEIAINLSFKPYSNCRWKNAALDCIKLIKQQNNLHADDVNEIIINSFVWVKTQEIYGSEGLAVLFIQNEKQNNLYKKK